MEITMDITNAFIKPHHEYLVFKFDHDPGLEELQRELDNHAAQGYRLVDSFHNGRRLIFERPTQKLPGPSEVK